MAVEFREAKVFILTEVFTHIMFLPSRRDNRFYKDIKALHGFKKHDDEL